MPQPTTSITSKRAEGDLLRVHDLTYGSMLNGPGKRNVLHLQGCTIGCPGCFSKHTWDRDGGKGTIPFQQVTNLLLSTPADGITISGGEPFQQTETLVKLLRDYRQLAPRKSVVIFTGYTKNYLRKAKILEQVQGLVDVIIAGPYVASKRVVGELRGSSNQEIMILSDEYAPHELVPPALFEVLVDGNEVVISGFPELDDVTALVEGLGDS